MGKVHKQIIYERETKKSLIKCEIYAILVVIWKIKIRPNKISEDLKSFPYSIKVRAPWNTTGTLNRPSGEDTVTNALKTALVI